MRLTRIISAALCTAMVFSLTGCFGGSKITPDKLVDYAKDEGAAVYDTIDSFNNRSVLIKETNMKNGYVTNYKYEELISAAQKGETDEEAVRKHFNIHPDVESPVEIAIYKKQLADGDSDVINANMFIFENNEAAKDYFDIRTKNDNLLKHGEENGIEYFNYADKSEWSTLREGFYLQDSCVLVIYCYSSNKDFHPYYDICKKMGLPALEDD